MLRLSRLARPVAQRDDRHNRFVFRNVEQRAKGIGITHTHDERIEAFGSGLQDKISITEAVVVGALAVAHLIGLLATEETRLAFLVSGDNQHGCTCDVLLVALAHKVRHCLDFLRTHGHIVF